MKPEFRENLYTTFATVQLASMSKSASSMAQSLRMPTQMEESELGYDANMEVGSKVVYLQYKVSDYLSAPNAKHYKEYNEPYYRFRVKTDIANGYIQHNALWNLQKNNPNAIVRYCAPIFHTYKALSEIQYSNFSSPAPYSRLTHYLSRTGKYGVLDHSALLSPTILAPVKPYKPHVITYSASSSKAVSFSSPNEGSYESFETVIENAVSSSERSTLYTVLSTMISEMQEAIDISTEENRSDFDLSPDEVQLVAKRSDYSESFYIVEALRLSDMLGVRPLILT